MSCVPGVVQSADDCQEVTSRQTQKSFMKREINLVDRSEKCVRVTLWGGDAEKFNGDDNPVMSIKVTPNFTPHSFLRAFNVDRFLLYHKTFFF